MQIAAVARKHEAIFLKFILFQPPKIFFSYLLRAQYFNIMRSEINISQIVFFIQRLDVLTCIFLKNER
jgi:hypothetical protein